MQIPAPRLLNWLRGLRVQGKCIALYKTCKKMKIELLTQEQHDELFNIYKSFPELTLENKGYEGINRREFSDEAKQADAKVNEILKANIVGFNSFQNFCHTKDGEIRVRLQYNWGAEDNSMYFTGVGYILLTELLNGFNEA